MTKEQALQEYASFIKEEYNDEWDGKGGIQGLLYTKVGEDEEYDLQVSYDFDNQLLITELTCDDGNGYTYKEKVLYEDLFYDFSVLYSYAHEIVEKEFNREDIEF